MSSPSTSASSPAGASSPSTSSLASSAVSGIASGLQKQLTSTTANPPIGGVDPAGFPMWAILLIIAGIVLLIGLIAFGAFLGIRRLQKLRKVHGVYCPQQEENLHAKHLPHISISPMPLSAQGLGDSWFKSPQQQQQHQYHGGVSMA